MISEFFFTVTEMIIYWNTKSGSVMNHFWFLISSMGKLTSLDLKVSNH